MWGVLAVYGPQWVCPSSQQHVLSSCTLLRLQGTLQGTVQCALPKSKLLRFRFLGTLQGHRLGWACVLCPSQVGTAQATRCLASALSQVGCARLNYLPGPGNSVSQVRPESTISGMLCVSSGELISGCDPPGRCQLSGSQEDVVSNWEPAHSLVEDSGLWG